MLQIESERGGACYKRKIMRGVACYTLKNGRETGGLCYKIKTRKSEGHATSLKHGRATS